MSKTALTAFKRAVGAAAPLRGSTLLKLAATRVEPMANRLIKFTVSTGAVDRDNDTVNVSGWDLSAFKTNPVVLWGHDADKLPIGRCVSIGVDRNALRAVVDFVPADMPKIGDLAEAVLRMCRSGYLSATSVGFRPLEFEIAKDRSGADDWLPGLNFIRQELMEFSIVSIPANAEALIDPAERAAPTTSINDNALRAARLRAYL